ncbi:hypothetical protein ACQY0O_001944 [Thecaphora frezii]
MRRMQKFIGTADSKPASAPIPSLSNSGQHGSSGSSGSSSSQAFANASTSSDSQYAASSSLQVPAGTSSSIFQNQLTAPYGSSYGNAPASPLRGSNPPSPNLQNRTVAQPPYADYFAASPVPSAGPMQTPRPITPVQATRAVSPGPGAAAPDDGLAIERTDLHKTLKALEGLLVNLDEYRDLAARMAKVEKKLAKSASELEKIKSTRQAPSCTLAVASSMFDALNEVSSKRAKQVQKEYEALNDSCAKYFKKVAKEERAHEELVDSLDVKIKKANLAHEKNVKKASGSRAVESHDKYIATVQGLTAEISKARASHWRSMTIKSHSASLLAASTVGGLADLDFRSRCESVRRVGPYVGKLNEWLSFTSSEAMPAMQPPDLDENEVLHAQFLAKAEAQIRAYADAQAEAQARMQEEVQTAIRAQQMGWRPPSAASQRPEETYNMANLPKLDENGKLIEPTSAADAGSSRISTDRVSVRSRATAAEADVASVRSVPAPAQPAAVPADTATANDAAATKEDAEKPPAQETPAAPAAAAASPQSGLSVPGNSSTNSGARLDRAPTGATMKSMAAQPEVWEQSSLADPGEAEETKAPPPQEQKQQEQQPAGEQSQPEATAGPSEDTSHDRKNSSTAEGTVVDRLSAPADGSEAEATMPSLSRSESPKGSEDGVRAPTTPVDGESPDSRTLAGVAGTDKAAGDDKASGDEGRSRGVPESHSAPLSPTKSRPAERALERYRELGDNATPSPRYPLDLRRVEEPFAYEQDAVHDQDEYSRARKLSLWERERERMRQLERESELQMRMREEQMLRSDPYGGYAPAPSSAFSSRPTSSLYGGRAPGFLEGPEAERGSYGRGPGIGGAGAMANEPYDPDRYAPAVGRSRLSGVSVTRTLSTDTTASERSFVARMKARYQAEKELEKSQRELNALEKEKAARRMAIPAPTELAPTGSRRVSEMASRYMGADAMGYGSRQPGPPSSVRSYGPPGGRYHDSLLPSGSVGGPRSLTSPPPPLSSGEFNGYRDRNRMSMPPRSGSPGEHEPPHSDVCGCQRCSVRHYGGAGPPSPVAQRPSALRLTSEDSREFNVRRQSMPVRPLGPAGDLQPPQQYVGAGYAAKSFEDLHAGQERKVAFAQSPRTIR